MDDPFDRFSTRTQDEIAAGPAIGGRPESKPISPIPAYAPPLDVKFKGRRPDEVFWFHNAKGERLFSESRWNFEGGPKEVRPACYTVEGWKLVAYPAPRPVYNLNRLSAQPHDPAWLFEGPRKAQKAEACFPGVVTIAYAGGANAIKQSDLLPLGGRHVTLWRDSDAAGARWVEQMIVALRAVGAASISVVNIAKLPAEMIRCLPEAKRGKFDIVDFIEAGIATGAIREAAEAACEQTEADPTEKFAGDVDDDRAIRLLARLSPLDYDRAREVEAERLGVRVSTLDCIVKAARRAPSEASDGVVFVDVEPSDAEINSAALLVEIRETIRRFIVCEPEVAVAVALWITFTWLIDRVEVAPLLVITAPEMRCGKSQLLSLVGFLSCRPLPASNISSAAVFRVIDAHAPTLVLDEADTFMKENEELRGVVNSGHTRQTAFVIRTVGDEHSPTRFSTWGAKAIAGIGRLAQTTLDRAVVVQLKRKMPSEKTERLRHADRGRFDRLCRMLARFAEDNGAAIEAARPHLPETLNDRAQDNWEPLLAIADCAGGHWPTMARKAALRLSGAAQEPTTQSTELLFDIRSVFDATGDQKISTAELLRALIGKEESPWATCNAGKPMTARNLAKRLSEYSIKSMNVRFGHEVAKGFHRSQFEDAFARYLPQTSPEIPATPRQNLESRGNAGVSECSVILSGAATDDNLPLPRQPEGGSETVEVAECGGIENYDATRKSPEINECSGVAEFGAGADNRQPAEPWGEFL